MQIANKTGGVYLELFAALRRARLSMTADLKGWQAERPP
jgi:hypothetical protein